MLDRHAVQEMVRAGLPLKAVARQLGVSRRTNRRIVQEAPVTTLTPAARVGRPPVDADVRQRLAALLTAEPERATSSRPAPRPWTSSSSAPGS